MSAPVAAAHGAAAVPPRGRAALAVVVLMWACSAPTWLALWPRAPRALPTDALALRLDLNTATAAELEQLPGLGPTRAARIVEYRTQAPQQPAFRDVRDLGHIPGFGPALMATLAPHLRFPDSQTDEFANPNGNAEVGAASEPVP